ncbi:helix-turn-helix domain-containing protein [Nocardioides xinjiangensis]|uniref:helix-turn-helix domain-containing protein n=1 Tax=Nocardioides xinjiangensis TaxID=2817376 RepID=UPI001B308514|nr:helix-turn-helix transcriptional regulator [Nocardioides sp. SYSU D00514]
MDGTTVGAAVTEAEEEWLCMGPFPGGVPGLVRRIRRILDVSQRGLAQALEVSQSAVARWETGRTSPRASVLQALLELARLEVGFSDRESGEPVEPMRADGARTRGSRFPAHADLRVAGWWVPRRLRAMTSIEALGWPRRSRAAKDPAIGYHGPWRKHLERNLFGTPVDHPARHQLVAEMVHLDEVREERRRRRLQQQGEQASVRSGTWPG